MMKTDEIRRKYLEFFKKRGHTIVQSDSLVPVGDPTLLFTGAGMNQFKDYFLGLKKDMKRATSSQKCLRTGDLENVGKTSYHHSFFEMLGNFSFGDYFKKEAIVWAWEFLTQELQIPKERLRVSVHKDDDDSYAVWTGDVGLPEHVVYRCGDKDNFWPANAPADGPNGPCGPCSEIFFDQGEERGCRRKGCSPMCDCGRFAEIWNLVFTQFDRLDGGKLVPLPFKNIDTGMGLERIACVMQHKQRNFDIDIFEPLVKYVIQTAGLSEERFESVCYSVFAICDHVRAAVFCINDGAYPSNEGRGYVVRKLIRRSVWHGKQIGIQKPFLSGLVTIIEDVMGTQYPDITNPENAVTDILGREEERFLSTLDEGLSILTGIIEKTIAKKSDVVSGHDVFRLYDTFGFPEELTRYEAEKRGLTVDKKAFESLMDEQRKKAKQSTVISDEIFTISALEKNISALPKTKFCGYEILEIDAEIIEIFKDNDPVHVLEEGSEGVVVLNKTPFYAESGGQTGDSGVLLGKDALVSVMDTKKKHDVYYHIVRVEKGTLGKHSTLLAKVNDEKRLCIMKNHSATHLLQAALRSVLGLQVRQLGSLVTAEKLRFDFSYHKAMTDEEKTKVEQIVNNKIKEALSLDHREMDIQAAKEQGALAFFGDKYTDTVRMVSIVDFSKELCGGTHVHNTKDIGKFKIVSESSIASGIRRIEAVTGSYVDQFEKELKEREAETEIKKAEKQQEKEAKKEMLRNATSSEAINTIIEQKQIVGRYSVIVHCIDNINQGGLRSIYDALKTRVERAIIALISENDGKLAILVALTKDLKDDPISADTIIKQLMKDVNGRGGGKKEMAFAGSKEIEKKEFARKQMYQIIKSL